MSPVPTFTNSPLRPQKGAKTDKSTDDSPTKNLHMQTDMQAGPSEPTSPTSSPLQTPPPPQRLPPPNQAEPSQTNRPLTWAPSTASASPTSPTSPTHFPAPPNTFHTRHSISYPHRQMGSPPAEPRRHSLVHPPNYMQNPYIDGTAEQRARYQSLVEEEKEEAGIWGEVSRFAKDLGDRLADAEEQGWKWLKRK
ncbi:hypothetical protein BT63DRAFT_276179 [Microthyrium microscopicum]|uniref:Uncharacterized protein n=1 Tax=Microthyrium microscopicum TaxID=703497 RepID=A0A6A6UBC8_9PEZI|nr:hypothetical protein BT63DRAFT_276179 [Microthyrium microscopicum]